MEGDMPLCNRHDIPMEMELVGNRWVCTDPNCGWGYDIPIHLYTYSELLAENEQLKKRIEELTQGEK